MGAHERLAAAQYHALYPKGAPLPSHRATSAAAISSLLVTRQMSHITQRQLQRLWGNKMTIGSCVMGSTRGRASGTARPDLDGRGAGASAVTTDAIAAARALDHLEVRPRGHPEAEPKGSGLDEHVIAAGFWGFELGPVHAGPRPRSAQIRCCRVPGDL